MKTDQQLRQEISNARKLLRERKRKNLGLPKRRKGVGAWDRDETLTAERGYSGGSFVRVDGSEVLKGKDWIVRKGELRERSGGRCEYEETNGEGREAITYRCHFLATTAAHIEPRHPKRDDRLTNLKHYCGAHDKLMEKQSWRRTRFGEAGAVARHSWEKDF